MKELVIEVMKSKGARKVAKGLAYVVGFSVAARILTSKRVVLKAGQYEAEFDNREKQS
jgi:hypothetical protein